MPYAAYYRTPMEELQHDLTEEQIRTAFQSGQGLLRVDVSETTPEDGEFLTRAFGFHPLAVEDCVSPKVHPPKIDEFPDHLFIVVHGVNYQATGQQVETAELALFLGPHYVVTNHNFPLLSIAHVRSQVEADGRPMQRGADFLAHAIMDALIDNVLPVVDRMTEVIDDIEAEVVRHPNQPVLEAILHLKRSVMRLHRVMAP